MLAASHALIGACIAQLVPQPLIGLPLSLMGHFIADIIPHWDFRTRHVQRTKRRIIFISLTDAVIGYLIGWILFHRQVPSAYLITMMFVGQLPDWLEAPYHIFDWNFPPFSWVKRLQSRLHFKLDLPMGLLGQIIIVAALISFSL